MIRKISLLCVSRINWNIKNIQLIPGQVAKRGIKKKAEGAYHIRKLASKDKDNTNKFLNRFFFRDEPMTVAVKLLENNDRCIELEEYVAKIMDDGISIAAVDDNGKLLGVVINALERRDDVATHFESIKYPKFQPIQRLLAHLDTKCRLWEKVPRSCNLVVNLKIASTDPKWRGKKILKTLVLETECLAKQQGACAIRIDATSAFSARAAERLGYKMIYCVLYADVPGGPRPLPPHIEARVYLKQF